MAKKKTQEESIMELYEKYLTDELIENSIREKDDGEDFEEEKISDHWCPIEKFKSYTIGKYINRFLDIHDIDYSKKLVTHNELKGLKSPYVLTVDNEFAEQNPDRVASGEILIIKDSRGTLKSYINPDYIRHFIDFNDSKSVMLAFLKKGIKDLELLKQYWSKSIIIKYELETNQGFLELLMDTNKVKNIDKIKNYMNIMKEVELDNATSEAGYMMEAANKLVDLLKEEVYQLSYKEEERMEFDPTSMSKIGAWRRYCERSKRDGLYELMTDEGVNSFDGEIIEQMVVFRKIPVQEILESIKEEVYVLAEALNEKDMSAEELRDGTGELQRRMKVLEKVKEESVRND